MPKLLWVVLPVLLALAWVAVQSLRGRVPSRLALNVGFSLLLLGYLAGTAALGVFWVANQQLPAFDWHYLFGYTAAALVAIHLAFNARVVWRCVRRAALPAPPGPATPPSAARRAAFGWLGGLAALAAGAAGYLLGLRQGRTELRFDATSLVDRFHARSSLSRRSVLRRAPSVEWGDAPPPFKRYSAAPRLALPPPRPAPAARAPDSTPELARLGALLWHTAGVTAQRGGIALRASPSSGALFATELYVAARGVDGLAPGLWHYDAAAHALERLDEGVVDAAALGAPHDPRLGSAAAVIVATAVFARSGHKYGERTYRYVLADLGHSLHNLMAAAGALGLRADLRLDFDAQAAARTLGVDDAAEGVLALVVLGTARTDTPPGESRDGAPPAAAAGHGGSRPASAPTAATTIGSASTAAALTGAIHHATAWSAPGHDHRSATAGTTSPAAAPALVPDAARLPSPPAAPMPVLDRIAARRSIRRYRGEPLALDAASALLASLHDGGPLRSHAVSVGVLTLAVAGLPAAAWRFEPRAPALVPTAPPAPLSAGLPQRGDRPGWRTAARAAALDQDVVGDAAMVVVFWAERAALAADPDGLGPAWRRALLHTGMLGERLYLEGHARGLGVCAVGAFYDEEAAALFGLDPRRDWVLHFTAVGVPAD